jgi:hypothetical protein
MVPEADRSDSHHTARDLHARAVLEMNRGRPARAIALSNQALRVLGDQQRIGDGCRDPCPRVADPGHEPG